MEVQNLLTKTKTTTAPVLTAEEAQAAAAEAVRVVVAVVEVVAEVVVEDAEAKI